MTTFLGAIGAPFLVCDASGFSTGSDGGKGRPDGGGGILET